MSKDSWSDLAAPFVDGHYGSLRGRVRTHVIDRQLRWHLPPPPGPLVDVGGGAGHQAIPLARAGYPVTVVDPSSTMLERAQGLLAPESAEVRRRVSLVHASAEAAAALHGARFAGVLCHGVIMYVEEPGPFLASLVELASPGAVISVVAKSRAVLAVRPALAGDWAGALAAFDNDRQINGLGADTRADSREDLADQLDRLGVTPVAWYGVRLFTDGWNVEQPAAAATDEILAVELEASRRDPYRQLSRLFHLVGVRR